MGFKPLPIGVDNFQELIEKNYYYVDKTLLIKELLDRKGKVNLFTRPRRFGKTLNMSMLQCFFEQGQCDAEQIFKDLTIMNAGEEYLKHMSRYPVISISLKSMKQPNYELSYMQMKKVIAEEFGRYDDILKSDKLTEAEKNRFQRIRDVQGEEGDYLDALKFLSVCLKKEYGRRTILLIDEYDVPLENSFFCGFYIQMVSIIHSLFESAMKTNDNLEFSVITGCLRISKESIFTGLNNLNVISVLNPVYAEHFGFTESEVVSMLHFYERDCCIDKVRTWYDGYCFGNTEVYNPWSVINYVEQLCVDQNAFPKPFWSNTSSNSIVRSLVEESNIRIKQEIEILIQGDEVEKPVYEDITYEDIGLDKSRDNLWNFLFFTGYLKKTKERMDGSTHYISMKIPNEEVRYIYKNTVLTWFEQKVKKKDFSELYKSIVMGDVPRFEKLATDLLREGISFYDNKEAFYHGFLMGILNGMEDYYAYSNREAGHGRYDICLKSLEVEKPAIIFEIKIAEGYSLLEAESRKALEQIRIKQYESGLSQDGFRKVLCYGLAFYKKNCKITLEEKKLGNNLS